MKPVCMAFLDILTLPLSKPQTTIFVMIEELEDSSKIKVYWLSHYVHIIRMRNRYWG